jgi:hypothetical protein
MQLLTRGPIHEAFAEPVVFDPQPGPIVPKEPPPPVEELPPAQKPAGDNVQWIPGYWSWDDQRNDYVWVSGLWRDVPPGRQWVPGYWSQAQGGFQWTSGFWAPTGQDQAQLQYLPAPPPSVESGPSGPAPSPDSTWSPGTWVWQDNRYAWQPGSWMPFQPDWVWVPPHYLWTPSGYLYNDGYWDRSLLERGQAFAPVYFEQPLYRQPGFTYTPSLGLLGSALASSLFVRPASQQYYFGDYYDASNFQSGIYPWYSFHQSRHGYDPLFAHYATLQGRNDPNWQNNLHEEYRYRRDHPEARPFQTYAQQRVVREGNAARNLVLARPIHQMASGSNPPFRFEQLDENRRRELATQGAQFRQIREQRQSREVAARAGNEPGPRPFELPRSPIIAHERNLPNPEPVARGPNPAMPPPRPERPRPDLSIAPPGPGQGHPRFEPHPDRLPPENFRPGRGMAPQSPPGAEIRRAPEPPRPPESRPLPPRPPESRPLPPQRQEPRPEPPQRKEPPRREPAKKAGRS